MNYNAIDIFSGCGGLSEGMRDAGFEVSVAVEADKNAVESYRLNHPETKILDRDIRKVSASSVAKLLKGKPLHLLAGCPPCQGFSTVRRLNKKNAVKDDRNNLILDYLRFIKKLNPLTIMMENVPGLLDYNLFNMMVEKLRRKNYYIDYGVVKIEEYGIPQRRKRLVLVGSRLGPIKMVPPTKEKISVRDTIEGLESVDTTSDPLHKIVAQHTPRIFELIKNIPKDGGSRKDLPKEYHLKCHQKPNVGFKDIYGRLSWDSYANTITGGCLNPSKGRFLHPEEDRVITPREAALLQTFPASYKFSSNISKAELALLIGNALPPKFSYIQTSHIFDHLSRYDV
jgi:DNA (cytosine-5)-methyltransferase 1